jgi:hypothetical protein
MVAPVHQDHAHRTLSDLRRAPVRGLLRHGSTFSRFRASGEPGAVHTLPGRSPRLWLRSPGHTSLALSAVCATSRSTLSVRLNTAAARAWSCTRQLNLLRGAHLHQQARHGRGPWTPRRRRAVSGPARLWPVSGLSHVR